ncbi:MFS transporter [Streptomyces sp. NPDC057654]|uniref:MFS transporter n=1 Tax=Streptomyces sp. NPDC057654 TaxID=3346196 RepID=UPI0036A05922
MTVTSTRPGSSTAPAADAPKATAARYLWRSGDFTALATGQAASVAGSAVSAVAIPLTAVTVLDASVGQTALLAACQQLPPLVVSLPAGALIDRMRRRPVMIGSDLVSAAATASIPAAAAVDWLTMWWLYTAALVVGTMRVTSRAATLAYLATLLEPSRLMDGTSQMVRAAGVAQLGGSTLAGVLIGVFGAARTILLDAASYLVSAACTARIRTPEPPPAPRVPGSTVRREVCAGLRYVRRDPIGWPVLSTNAITCGVVAGQQAVLALYLIRGLGWDGTTVGLILAASGAGGVLGAVLAPGCERRFGPARTMIAALLIAPLSQVPLILSGPGLAGQITIALALATESAAAAVGGLTQQTVRMAVCAPAMHGRMHTVGQLLCAGPAPVAALLAGAVATTLGLRATLILCAVLLLAPPVRLAASPLRRLHRLPEPARHGHDGDHGPSPASARGRRPALTARGAEQR